MEITDGWAEGVVTRWNSDSGAGAITLVGGQIVQVVFSVIAGEGYRELSEGQQVWATVERQATELYALVVVTSDPAQEYPTDPYRGSAPSDAGETAAFESSLVIEYDRSPPQW